MMVYRPKLRTIERCWSAPMANSMETRIRFAIWDTMRYAATLSIGDGRRRIVAALRKDEALFDKSGMQMTEAEMKREKMRMQRMFARADAALAKRNKT